MVPSTARVKLTRVLSVEVIVRRGVFVNLPMRWMLFMMFGVPFGSCGAGVASAGEPVKA